MNAVPPAALEAIPQRFHALIDNYWRHLFEQADDGAALSRCLDQRPGLLAELLRLWVASDYAATLCTRKPALLHELLESGDLEREYTDWSEHLDAAVGPLGEREFAGFAEFDKALKQCLRLFRQREMLRILWRDLCGHAALMQTCGDMTAMADAVLQYSLRALHPWCVREWGEPRDAAGHPQQLVVLAMGKHGAGELNLSSDIDLIFAFPEGGETSVEDGAAGSARACDNQVFFTRLGQRLIDALDSRTEEGFVFRLDLRLRPYGESGALAMSFDAMEQYYQSQGRDWERFAMIKARVAAGDHAAGRRLMQTLRPFVYRRYLDFAAIDALRDMKRMIMQQVRRKGMHENIKLGEGGIREVEFIVQVLQLIYGGRDRTLQSPSLLRALEALVGDGYMAARDAAELRRGYFFLRRVEHCLQALQDKQTQKLPADPQSRARVAFAMGCEDWPALRRQLDDARRCVAGHFQGVIAEAESPGEDGGQEEEVLRDLWREEIDEERAQGMLAEMGFARAREVLSAIAAYRGSKQFQGLESTGKERLERLMTVLLEAVTCNEEPDLAFLRVFSFVQNVTRRSAYLVLLLENPVALRQLIDLCQASPWIVECLSKYPVLLDELLKPLTVPPEKDELADELRQQMLRTSEEDLDQQMESLRYFKQVHVLLVAAAELAQTMPLMKVSDYLTYIAEAILHQVVQITWATLCGRHGSPVNHQGEPGEMHFAVIGYGKLGGIELNYGSDLDLVFLHDANPDEETRGGEEGRALNSQSFYARLGQRIINMLNTTTMTGKLYEVDLRLRPSGASGLLVSSLRAFEQYQGREAWTWEHQALIRARLVAGSAAMGERFEAIRKAVLCARRDRDKLREDIVSMRRRMRRELGTREGAGSFDIKQDAGGLVDIEFIVQYLVLAWASEHEDLVEFSDNMRLLEAIERNRLLEQDEVQALKDTYILYRSRLHRLALQQTGNVLDDGEYGEERARIEAIWSALFPAGGDEPA